MAKPRYRDEGEQKRFKIIPTYLGRNGGVRGLARQVAL